MRISFDVDDTLVCGPATPCEQFVSRWRRWVYHEPMRWGTRDLMHELVTRRCDIWIYTTSFRPARYLNGWFRALGVQLGGVVNQHRHDRLLRRSDFGNEYPPSKYPRAYGIDLHVDDSEGVAEEGRRFGFRVLVVSPDDESWASKVLAAVR
ncbi:MAG TPA: hypothetical protein VKE40_05680 [Gemmataceae bacterium]|nr:hypothetical protein [Gemmataceae bacterium]